MTDVTAPETSFDTFHTALGPAVAERGEGVVAEVGPGRELTLEVDGKAWTYSTDGGVLGIAPGGGGTVEVTMDASAFGDLSTERQTIFGLLYSGRLRVARGEFDGLARWESGLTHLWFGRPRYDDAARAGLVGTDGQPLDLTTSFRLDGDDGPAIHFLRTVGFAVVRDVFGSEEIAALRAEVERVRREATPEDGRSWWATTSAGEDVCCRLTYMSLRSELFATLHEDPRLQRVASWHGSPLRSSWDRLDGHTVVIKNPDVVRGLSDLPWHRDCGLGGHPVLCPSLLIGIQLTRAAADVGQLRFLAGSHLRTGLAAAADRHPEWPVVDVVTQPGDITVHYSDVLHVAPPPSASGPARMTAYVTFNNPAVFDVVPPGKGYNDVLFNQGDGRILSVEDL